MKLIVILFLLCLWAAPAHAIEAADHSPTPAGDSNTYPSLQTTDSPVFSFPETSSTATPADWNAVESAPKLSRKERIKAAAKKGWKKTKKFCKETLVPLQWAGAATGLAVNAVLLAAYLL